MFQPAFSHRHGGGAAVMSGGVATELDRRIAAALKATAGSIGPLGGTVKRLNSIHKTLQAQRASGQLTDAQYAKEAGGLLNILSNLDGLIAEVAMGDRD
jgi:ABC-type transporter Mla subunit MlaD